MCKWERIFSNAAREREKEKERDLKRFFAFSFPLWFIKKEHRTTDNSHLKVVHIMQKKTHFQYDLFLFSFHYEFSRLRLEKQLTCYVFRCRLFNVQRKWNYLSTCYQFDDKRLKALQNSKTNSNVMVILSSVKIKREINDNTRHLVRMWKTIQVCSEISVYFATWRFFVASTIWHRKFHGKLHRDQNKWPGIIARCQYISIHHREVIPMHPKNADFIFFFLHNILSDSGMGQAIRKRLTRDGGVCMCWTKQYSNYGKHTGRPSGWGRDVEMCSDKKKAMAEARHRKVQSVQSGSSCIRHQRCVPIPFFAEPSENSMPVLCIKRQARKEKEEESKTKKRLAKIGQLELMMFSRYQYAHTFELHAFDSGDDDDDDMVPLQ